MASTTNIQVLLKHVATRQNNAIVNVLDFCEYMRRYAQHNLEEQPELINYLTHAQELVKKELEKLAETRQVIMLDDSEPDKQAVIVIGFYIDKFASRYQEMLTGTSIPYPSHLYLPKNTPAEVYKKEDASIFFETALALENSTEKALYCLQFPRNLPTILFPSTISPTILLEIALSKLKEKLGKEEFHDYFLKKLKISNPGKELSIKNFFTAITQKKESAMASIKESGETFYQWSQLCFFIKQDFDKVKDLTQEDIGLLQSICIIEYCAAFYRSKAQQDAQRNSALKCLEQSLNKPPYYFTKDSISKFVDSRGIPLIGQYTESDLNEYLHTATTESPDTRLPKLLTFKSENGGRCYISKLKVIPLIMRLCNDARETVREIVIKDCHNSLKNFESMEEMKNQDLFEQKLENLVSRVSPILHSLLKASFLQAVYFEARAANETPAEIMQLFHDGLVPPYSELLMISKDEILTDAKILLPFWYSIPLVTWFVSLIKGNSKKKKAAKKTEKKQQVFEKNDSTDKVLISSEKRDPAVSRKMELKQAAEEIEIALVPSNSTLERELVAYEQIWNKLINKQSRENLTEDVNSLIRDYMRRILKTLRGNNFTTDRIKNLAETLVKTPGMQKIKDQSELCMYIQLYMVRLIKNMQ